MRTNSRAIPWALCVVAAGCIGPTETTFDEDDPVGFGGLRVVTVSTWSSLDPDGYRVRLDESLSSFVEPNGEVIFGGLPTKAYDVVLEELGGCTASGPNPRSVTIVAGTTIETTFMVSCP